MVVEPTRFSAESAERTKKGRLSNKTHENTETRSNTIEESLDIQEIEELTDEVVDQEQGNVRTGTSLAQRKLAQEKSIQKK